MAKGLKAPLAAPTALIRDRTIVRCLALAALALTLHDTAPHKSPMIQVAQGAELEVLDFGGRGDVVVLLAGLGNSAHVFDEFALGLIDAHHVVAITRRGYGASSAQTSGYDVATRAADDLAVLDAIHVDRATFVGHSIAGDS